MNPSPRTSPSNNRTCRSLYQRSACDACALRHERVKAHRAAAVRPNTAPQYWRPSPSLVKELKMARTISAAKHFDTSKLFFRIAVFFFGSIPWLSFFRGLFQLSLHGLPARIAEEYERLRNLLFRPIVDFLAQYGFPLPAWLMDLAIVYLLVTAVFFQGSRIHRISDRAAVRTDPEKFFAQIRAGAKKNGKDPERKLQQVLYGLKPGLFPWVFYQLRCAWSGIRWPAIIIRQFRQLLGGQSSGAANAWALIKVWGLTLMFALGGVGFYLLLSHVSQLAG